MVCYMLVAIGLNRGGHMFVTDLTGLFVFSCTVTATFTYPDGAFQNYGLWDLLRVT